jgi:hypothetical protein
MSAPLAARFRSCDAISTPTFFFTRKRPQQRHQLDLVFQVEKRVRLVEQDRARLLHQRPADENTLPLPPGDRVERAVEDAAQIERAGARRLNDLLDRAATRCRTSTSTASAPAAAPRSPSAPARKPATEPGTRRTAPGAAGSTAAPAPHPT